MLVRTVGEGTARQARPTRDAARRQASRRRVFSQRQGGPARRPGPAGRRLGPPAARYPTPWPGRGAAVRRPRRGRGPPPDATAAPPLPVDLPRPGHPLPRRRRGPAETAVGPTLVGPCPVRLLRGRD